MTCWDNLPMELRQLTYRETIDIDDNSIASPDGFHSIQDDEARDGNQSTQDGMILSSSIVTLNIK
jgi:hypothetical protein